jgi:arabinose-5-phosphate isomerase
MVSIYFMKDYPKSHGIAKRMTSSASFEQLGREVIQLEAEALQTLATRIDGQFADACRLILACTGRVIVTGMGKSGHIGGKIAATLASTGTPSFFVHPGEASHGDLGMITPADVVLAISNSGETEEILTILPIIKRMGVKLVALTGGLKSSLAQQADAVLNAGVEMEACPHNLAPTASTTVALAIGDALAVALLKSRGFTREDFARAHPAGSLGRRLLLYVNDIMHTGTTIPQVTEDASLSAALLEMTGKGLGMTGVVDNDGRLVGILTDGDLRRVLSQNVDVYRARITDLMTRHPKTTRADRLAAETVHVMRSLKINGLFVVDENQRVIGALNMHDLFRAGVI